jgi:hypothetical protein
MATRSRAARTTAARSKRPSRRAPAGEHRAAARAPRPRPQGISPWAELKLELVRKYATAYSTILSRQPGLAHYWIDGFAGPGVHVPWASGLVPGSPLNALLVRPPFRHHYLIDLDGERVEALRPLVGDRDDVTLLEGDRNRILLEDVFPRVRQDDYRRALCVLDPSAAHVDWRVLEMAGRLRTIDLFVTLPPGDVHGWLAETPHDGGAPQAFARRLREEARFANVLEPLALRDGEGRLAGHLCFASRSDTANKVVEDIFAAYR